MILGIESSCDETAASVINADGHVLSSVVASQIPVHARYGGVVPELASRCHLTAIRPTVSEALRDARVTLDDLTGVAVTAGPGLAGCLLVGLQAAKGIAWGRGLPLIPVDHIEAHIHAPFLKDGQGAGDRVPGFPYVALAVSGGHTSLYRVEAPGEVVRLGQTLDDAAGEAFDKIAKMMGLPYPGGVHIDRLSAKGRADAYELPRPILHRGLDFSFSGLKTSVRYLLDSLGHPDGQLPADVMADIAASAQAAIVDVLTKKAIKACKEQGLKELVIAGGVACNSGLRSALATHTSRRGIELFATPARYCTDNAAMIAGLGLALLERGAGLIDDQALGLDIYTTQRPARA